MVMKIGKLQDDEKVAYLERMVHAVKFKTDLIDVSVTPHVVDPASFTIRIHADVEQNLKAGR